MDKEEKREQAKKAMDLKKKKEIEKKIEEGDTERVDFKVYNMPSDLVNKYISLAKLHYDNEVWKVLKKGMELLMQEKTPNEKLKEKIEELEVKVSRLETLHRYSEEKSKDSKKKSTLGQTSEKNKIDKLKEVGGDSNDEN